MTSLINLDGLSEPATALINRISDALGGAFKPLQIKRLAKAEVEAGIIKANGDIEIQEIQRRALRRFMEEETRKQINIEKITAKAIPSVKEDARPSEIDGDWLTYFFDKAKLVSDESMQDLWAKVLAGEANAAGSFSKRTLSFLSDLSAREARMIEIFLSLGVEMGGVPRVIVNNYQDPFLKKRRINFQYIIDLQSFGILTHEGNGYTAQNPNGSTFVSYFNEIVGIKFSAGTNSVNVGKILLTPLGKEIFRLCNRAEEPSYFEHLLWGWAGAGAVVYCPYPKAIKHSDGFIHLPSLNKEGD